MILLMINIKTMLLLAIVCIIAVSCARMFTRGNHGGSAALTAYSNVNVDEFQTLIADPAMQLLDVRTPEEYDAGHIARATLVDVNDSSFVERAMAVLDRQRPVAVYCRSGRRSARAANLLAAQGYAVTNLNGGVMAWQDAGKALVK
jgi:rhodanese-related sulfurtransferase